jgi:hypothetical protein
MNLSRFFDSLKVQQCRLIEFEKILKDDIQKEIEAQDRVEMSKKYDTPHLNEQIENEY